MSTRSTYIVFAGVILSLFLYAIDGTIVNVAIEHIQRSFHASYTSIEWIISAYQLGLASSLIFGAQMAYRFSPRKIMIFGDILFIVFSMLCGASKTENMLIFFRAAQGLAAGILYSQVAILSIQLFERAKRAAAFSVVGATTGIALVLGPLVGGILLNYDILGVGWRSIFYVNLPVGIIAFVLLCKDISYSKSLPISTKRKPLNILFGNLLFITSVVLLIFGLNNGRTYHWNITIKGALVGSFVAAAVFVVYEITIKRKTKSFALFDLAIFKSYAFSSVLFLLTVLYVLFGSFFLMFNVYLQQGMGKSALYSGAALIPFAVGMSLGSIISNKLFAQRIKLSVLTGIIISFIGLSILYVVLGKNSSAIPSFFSLTPGIGLYGFGIGHVLPQLMSLAFLDDDDPIRSGITTTIQQIGLALGIAIIGGAFFNAITGNFKSNVTYSVDRGINDGLRTADIALSPQEVGMTKLNFISCVKAIGGGHKNQDLCSSNKSGGNVKLANFLKREVKFTVHKSFNESLKGTIRYIMVGFIALFFAALLLMKTKKNDQDAG